MDTKKVNSVQSEDNKKDNMNSKKKVVAAGMAGVLSGGTAGVMADDIVIPEAIEPDPNPEPEPVPVPEPDPIPEPEPAPAPEPDPIIEPTPIVEDDSHEEEVQDPTFGPDKPTGEVTPPSSEGEEPYQPVQEDVDAIVDAVLSEIEVDPDDIDMEEVIHFDEVGTVYTVTGESYTAASFHQEDGTELVMLEVDGDEVFDVIATPTTGEIVAETANDLTVSDAELMINDNSVYLAQNEFEQENTTLGEDIVDDLIQS